MAWWWQFNKTDQAEEKGSKEEMEEKARGEKGVEGEGAREEEEGLKLGKGEEERQRNGTRDGEG